VLVAEHVAAVVGVKKLVCMTRSNITKNCEPAMNGVARTTSSDVVKFAHTRSGMRQNVIPARAS
jgi:hypothetical protein